MSREQWWLVNLTTRSLSIGDLPKLPAIPAGGQVELLQHALKDQINQSANLIGVIRLGWAKLIKKLDNNTIGTATTVSQLKNITESVERDELETEISEIPAAESGGLNQTGTGFTENASGGNAGGFTATSGTVAASGIGSFAFGRSASSGAITSNGNGALAHGYSSGSGSSVSTTGPGSTVFGSTGSGGKIRNTSSTASLVFGRASTANSVVFSDYGSANLVFGRATGTATIDAGGDGCFAGGVASTGTITVRNPAYGVSRGCWSFGYANTGGVIRTGSSSVTTLASFAMGKATGASALIEVTGNGSFAGGEAAASETISATAAGAFQWGPGTNATTDSLQVGNNAFRALVSGAIHMGNLPTSDPSVAGALWNDTGDGNTLKVSAG